MTNLPTHKKEYDANRFLIAEGSVHKGKKNGFWIEYYPRKVFSEQLRVKARGFYKNDQKIGRWYEYHWSGMPKGYGDYLYDQKVNRWYYFNNQRQLVSSFSYPVPIKVPQTQPVVLIEKASQLLNFLKNMFCRQNS